MKKLIEAVLFDMGGVLIRLGSLPELLGQETSSERFWPAWLASPAVRKMERGECSVEEFADAIVEEMQLSLTPDDFIDRFLQFPQGLLPGAVEMVDQVRVNAKVGLLSNTNALHWEHMADKDRIHALFCPERQFLSFRLKYVKPDPRLFDSVISMLQTPADRILFLDDNMINVEGARAVGITSYVTKGVDAAVEVLRRYELLRSKA